MLIKADEDAKYSAVMDAMDELRGDLERMQLGQVPMAVHELLKLSNGFEVPPDFFPPPGSSPRRGAPLSSNPTTPKPTTTSPSPSIAKAASPTRLTT